MPILAIDFDILEYKAIIKNRFTYLESGNYKAEFTHLESGMSFWVTTSCCPTFGSVVTIVFYQIQIQTNTNKYKSIQTNIYLIICQETIYRLICAL